jgi:S1-C subfamily serine protease
MIAAPPTGPDAAHGERAGTLASFDDTFHDGFRGANSTQAGATCPHCNRQIHLGDPIQVCSACGSVQHDPCFRAGGGCGSYQCIPGRRDLSRRDEARLKITARDLDEVVPLPSRPAAVFLPEAQPSRRRRTGWNRLTLISFFGGLAGIGLFGVAWALAFRGLQQASLVIIPFGVVLSLTMLILGCIGLATVAGSQQSGLLFGVGGILLGLGEVIVWGVFYAFNFLFFPQGMLADDFRPDLEAVDAMDAKVARAMRANVFIADQRRGVLGSGVILKITRGEALILTNRHVVDPDFDPDDILGARNQCDNPNLMVEMIDGSSGAGRVVWIAPDGVDLALVRTGAQTKEARVARWKLGRRPEQESEVFAIGNPEGFKWKYSRGKFANSEVRDHGRRQLKVLRAEVDIRPGNSGGGLYDDQGYLIGINTMTWKKRLENGLGLAINLEMLRELSPPAELDLNAGSEDADKP